MNFFQYENSWQQKWVFSGIVNDTQGVVNIPWKETNFGAGSEQPGGRRLTILSANFSDLLSFNTITRRFHTHQQSQKHSMRDIT